MGPRKEQNACQRTFLLLMLIAVVLFGVHFESDHNGFKLVSNLPASLGSRSVVDCTTVGFFLKISKEIGKAWRKSLTRKPHTPIGCVRQEKKKPTVRFPYSEFVLTRGFKNVVKLSTICSQLRPLCESDTLGD